MDHKRGSDRNQLVMFSLESAIPTDSFVRVVDAFVDAINLKSFGFAHVKCKEEGRPLYHPAILLKLYLYGYHYGIRTTNVKRFLFFYQELKSGKIKKLRHLAFV